MTHQRHGVSNGKLDVGHVHQLIRLLAETQELPPGSLQRQQYLVLGVARIVGAVLGGSVLETHCAPARRGPCSVEGRGGCGGTVLRSLDVSGQAGGDLEPLIRAMMSVTPREPGAAVTATWNELVTGSEHPGQAPRTACFADALLSSVRLRSSSCVHGLGLYRGPGSRPFSEEERNLVQVFHSECEGLLCAASRGEAGAASVGPRLSPRQLQTLDLVLNGLCDKEIAERLGISRYTVNQYTKVIYRHYAVTSRAQLMARMLGQPPARHSLIVGTGAVATAL